MNTYNDHDEYYGVDGYFDGVPEFIKKMTSEELEEAIIKEKKKCEEMNKKNKK